MNHYAGIDVSFESSTICVVDGAGKILREAKVASEPGGLIAWFRLLGIPVDRIGLEAGPLSQWLYAALREAKFAVELLETRHVRDAFKSMPVKSDRNDARGIAQLMRLGWFRPVHCKSLAAAWPDSKVCSDVTVTARGSATREVLRNSEETAPSFRASNCAMLAGHMRRDVRRRS